MPPEKTTERIPIRDLVRYFLRLGLLGFGGPVALVGQMERELVGEKKWLTKEEMREGIAVCQSLPGPLAIQVGIWISYIRGGFWGAWAGGWAFILPNFVIVAALGALYVHFGGLPWVTAIFYGVSPAVIALFLHSCYRLTKLGMKDWLEWALAAAAFVITVAVQAEVALVFIGCGIVGLLYYGPLFRGRQAGSTTPSLLIGIPLLAGGTAPPPLGALLGKLLAVFLKAGSLTFGSGLVIVPFLDKGLVPQTGWLTERDRLVDRGCGPGEPRRPLPLESQYPSARGRHGDHRPHRVPAAQAGIGIREVGSERPNVMRLLLLGLGIAASCLAAGAGDVDSIQGVITELHPQGFILATEGRTVVVDMSALGGITMALAAPMVFTPLLTSL